MKRWEKEEATQRMIARIKQMRKEVQDVLNDEEKNVIQKKILNDVFMAVALNLEGVIQPQLKTYFDAVARRPEDKFSAITTLLTSAAPDEDEKSQGPFTPLLALPLHINPQFLDIAPEDLKAMKGYIAMHQVARHYDVAIKIYGLTREEQASQMGAGQTILFVDIIKPYEQGVEWNPGFYPDLPALKPQAEKPFDIREKIEPKRIPKPRNDFTA